MLLNLIPVISFWFSINIIIRSVQTNNVNGGGRRSQVERNLSLRRKRRRSNVFEMEAKDTITSILLIKPVRVSHGKDRH